MYGRFGSFKPGRQRATLTVRSLYRTSTGVVVVGGLRSSHGHGVARVSLRSLRLTLAHTRCWLRRAALHNSYMTFSLVSCIGRAWLPSIIYERCVIDYEPLFTITCLFLLAGPGRYSPVSINRLFVAT